jgi:hypothetical protein
MKNGIISHKFWQEITDAAMKCKQKCHVAVAYMGKGGAAMLPLPIGSKLVVDASKGAVSSGQTNPWELLELLNNGVDIYSYEELHAKVFVIGSRLYIGSNNVSGRSQERLQEAAFTTTEKIIVGEAREFVKRLCIPQLKKDKADLEALCSIYKPPKTPQAKEVAKSERIRGWIMHTEPYDIPDYATVAINKGKSRLKDSSYLSEGGKHDYMYWEGRLPLRNKDVFFLVHHTGRVKTLYSEAVVLFVEPVEDTNEHVIFYGTDRRRSRNFQKLNRATKDILNSTQHIKRIKKSDLNALRQIT